jgi:membrane AbrB-like protein
MVFTPNVRAQFLALLIGVICGVGSYLLGLPLPWMLGPMIGLTLFSVAGAPVMGPDRLRPIVIPVIGVMLGSAIRPDIFSQVGGWAITLSVLPLYLAIAAGLSFLIYRRLGQYDPVTAFYASMPGGLNEMLIMGAAADGDERKIALAHAARVLLVILFVAVFFGLFLGVRSGANPDNWVGVTAPNLRDYVLLIAAAVIGLWVGRWLRLPAVPIFGPMIVSGVFHVVGWVEIAPPSVFIVAAQVVMGTIIGTRFIGATMQEIRCDLTLAAIGSSVMLVVAVGFAFLITWAAGVTLSEAFLAFAPGGLTEMSLLTLAMGQDVTYVSTVHIIRITLVIAIAPAVFAALRSWLMRSSE